MSKTKNRVTQKSTKNSTAWVSPKLVVYFVFAGVLLMSGFLYKSMVQKSDINLIQNTSPYQRSTIATPVNPQVPLCAEVTTLSLANHCGGGSYRELKYTCGKSTKVIVHGGACKSLSDLYSEAQANCATKCPSPKPTPTPKISPTPTPIPSVMCSQVYGSCISKDKTCIRYTDSCQKYANCLEPAQKCGEVSPNPTAPSYPSAIPSPTAIPYNTPVPVN